MGSYPIRIGFGAIDTLEVNDIFNAKKKKNFLFLTILALEGAIHSI